MKNAILSLAAMLATVFTTTAQDYSNVSMEVTGQSTDSSNNTGYGEGTTITVTFTGGEVDAELEVQVEDLNGVMTWSVFAVFDENGECTVEIDVDEAGIALGEQMVITTSECDELVRDWADVVTPHY